MDHSVGAASDRGDRVNFDPRVRLEFCGAQLSSNDGLLAMRELDDTLGLSGLASAALRDTRRGKNTVHRLDGLFRKSVFGRLPPLSGKLSSALILEVYSEAGGIGRRIGLLTGTEGCGSGKDAAAEQHALGPTGQGGRDQRGDACQVAGRGAGEGVVPARRQGRS